MKFDITFWVDIAKIIIALMSVLGFIVSVYFSRKTLKELQQDRRLNRKPHLLFDTGGHQMGVVIKKDDKDNKEYVQLAWPEINGKKMLPYYGNLKNYGLGPAIDVTVTWYIETIWVGKEKFIIDSNKRKEWQYSEERNTDPLHPHHLQPEQETGLHSIPGFILCDHEKKITKAEGKFILLYKDVFDESHKTEQGFYVFTDYENIAKGFHVTFSDIIREK